MFHAPYASTQLSPVVVYEPVYSADFINLTLDLDGMKPLDDVEATKTTKSTKAMKLAASSTIAKAKKFTCYFGVSFLLRRPAVRRFLHAVIVYEGTIDKCTFSTRSALVPVLYQIVRRSSTI